MNNNIIEILSYLSILRTNEKDSRRAIAYKKAISSIIKYDKEIKSAKEAEKLDGIGPSISTKIGEILHNQKNNLLRTGIPDLDNLSDEKYNEIKTIYLLSKDKIGIGYVKAKKLYDEGTRTLDDVSDNKMVKYREDLSKKINYKIIDKFYNIIDNIVDELNKKHKTKLRSIILGSYCRGAFESGDVDLLWYSKINGEAVDFISEFLEELTNKGILLELDKDGPVKKRLICKIEDYHAFQCDIEIVHNYKEEYFYKLLYFTGSDTFVKAIRNHADKEYGYRLTNHQMIDADGEKIIVNSEKEIFKILNIKYTEPENRTFDLDIIS